MKVEQALRGGASEHPSRADGNSRLLIALCALSLALALAVRLFVGWDVPLWLDEVFTAMIAVQPTASGLLRDVLNELGGLVYYGFIWAWEKVAGSSNTAFRIPSLVFSIAAPTVALWRGPGDLRTRLVWAAILALWVPALDQAKEARPYALTFLLGTAQVILFVRLLKEPGRGRALAWSTVSVLAILTHYYALPATGLQGLAYLAVHRGQAIRTWPAAVPFALAFLWMAFHIPTHLRFADPDVAWQTILTIKDIRPIPHLLFNGDRLATLLALTLVATTGYDLHRWRRDGEAPYPRAEILAVGCSLAAFVIIYGMGFLRPSFTPRYILPSMPGILFGLALWARHWAKRFAWSPHAIVLWFLVVFIVDAVPRVTVPKRDWRWFFEWETAMPFLKQNGGKRLLFFWDSRTAGMADEPSMARVAAYFLRQEGDQMPVSALIMAGRAGPADPHDALIARTPMLGDAFIWFYDLYIPGAKAKDYPPDLPRLGSNYRCEDRVDVVLQARGDGHPKRTGTLICVRVR